MKYETEKYDRLIQQMCSWETANLLKTVVTLAQFHASWLWTNQLQVMVIMTMMMKRVVRMMMRVMTKMRMMMQSSSSSPPLLFPPHPSPFDWFSCAATWSASLIHSNTGRPACQGLCDVQWMMIQSSSILFLTILTSFFLYLRFPPHPSHKEICWQIHKKYDYILTQILLVFCWQIQI